MNGILHGNFSAKDAAGRHKQCKDRAFYLYPPARDMGKMVTHASEELQPCGTVDDHGPRHVETNSAPRVTVSDVGDIKSYL